jgi:predicted aspartyl protease
VKASAPSWKSGRLAGADANEPRALKPMQKTSRPLVTRVLVSLAFTLAATSMFAATDGSQELDSLYVGHHWFQLRDASVGLKTPALYQGAVAAAFDQRDEAVAHLQRAIAAAPHSQEAVEARDLLIHLYMRAAQYSKAVATMKEQIAARIGKPATDGDRASMALLSQLPDTTVTARGASTLHYEMRGANLSAPISINDKPANFVLDTDANMSALSESEAKRLGMTILNGPVAVVGVTGGTNPGGRMAVAQDFIIGNFHFKNVAFFVISDDQEPFVDFPNGKRGIIGMSVILALQTLRWRHDGTIEIGFASPAGNLSRANICFNNEDPITQVEFQQHKLEFVMDTGAEDSELWPPFAKDFSGLLSQAGKKDSKTLTGFEGIKDVESVTLPEVRLTLGGFNDVLRSAPVLMKPTVALSNWYYGRAGIDLLNQAQSATMDFHAMTLTLNEK